MELSPRTASVDDATLEALERCLDSGRKLVLVTGRELPELQQVFPGLNLFEWVVAENGALALSPRHARRKTAGPAPLRRIRRLAAPARRQPMLHRPRHRRRLGTARNHHLANHSRSRFGIASNLQQRRGDGAALGNQQSHRLGRRAAGIGPVAPQHRGHRRRGKRSCASGQLRSRRRRRQRAAHAQRARRLGHSRQATAPACSN